MMETTRPMHETAGFDEGPPPEVREYRGGTPSPVHNGGQVPAPSGAGTAVVTYDFGDDAGAGFEGTRLEEQTTPFLRMAQGLSPELDRNKGEYIRGLAIGDVFNTASREVYDGREGLECVFCWKEYGYGLWVPRELGSGFRGMVQPEDPIVQSTLARMRAKYGSSARFRMPRYDGATGRWSDEPARTADTGEAVQLVETGQLYALYATNGELRADTAMRAIISFSSTALGPYANYVTRHSNAKFKQPNGTMREAPIFAYKWRLSTFQDKNPKGEFYNWRLDLSPPGASFVEALYARHDPDLFALAREFYAQAKSGHVKAEDPLAHRTEDGSSPSSGGGYSDDVPF